ncbi:MAG: polysaccharide deacetylase family protein [Betaproteobacteria bacterium]
MIAEFNDISEPRPGQPLVVPLQSINPTGVFANGYQTVPILCYHRFGADEGKMVVSPKAFAQQMEFLKRNGYRPVRLADLAGFLQGNQALPKRAVVLTMDDGYASMYHHAYPVLKQYGFPATVFVYTDFIGARDALTWDQMREMVTSGLVDIQAHSKTHSSLTVRSQGETEAHYRQRVNAEATTPREILQHKLRVKISAFAYPYGDTSGAVMEQLARANYKMALTVDVGGNPFFTPPLLLRRTMILGDQDDLESFKARLQVFSSVDLR